MSTTTPTGLVWHDPIIIYRGLVFRETDTRDVTFVYAWNGDKELCFVFSYDHPRQKVTSSWDRVSDLIHLAQLKGLRAYNGVPWEIHKIQDSSAWRQALEAWSAAQ